MNSRSLFAGLTLINSTCFCVFLLISFRGIAQDEPAYSDDVKYNATINLPDGERTSINQFQHTSIDSVDPSSANDKKIRPWVIGAATAAAYSGSLIILNKAWYEDYIHTSFHTFNDAKEWLQVDKSGHSWSAYHTARASAALWQWSGLPHQKAVWIGGLGSFAYLAGIEFMDAHSAKWGWSWSDIAANVFGSALFIGQELGWQQQRFQFKFSFHKNNYGESMLEKRADELFGKSLAERMLKDYNAQTYWLSANIQSFFPDSKLPSWLNIAAGYGGSGMFGGFENKWENEMGDPITRDDIPRKRQFYLAPDIDFTKIKTNSRFLRTVFFMLNAFKCPSPALMMDSKGKMKAYLLYF